MKSIFLNGTVGVGKSTAAENLGCRLVFRSIPHAIIDLDSIRQFWPAPMEDKFNLEIELLNLSKLAVNYQRAGAQFLIIAGVIENRDALMRYRKALNNGQLYVCRLTAAPEILQQRLKRRHTNDEEGLEWHLQRSAELNVILVEAGLDDSVVDTSTLSPQEVAGRILASTIL